MISPLNSRAMAIDSDVFPLAVGPTIAMAFGRCAGDDGDEVDIWIDYMIISDLEIVVILKTNREVA